MVNVFHGLDAAALNPPSDPDGRVHPYAVLFAGGGQRIHERLAGGPDRISWRFQVTCAGGDTTRALACVDAVTAALDGRRLVAGGWSSTPLQQDLDPGPLREDRDGAPSRWYLPLQYVTTLSFTPA
jgi:hypothetical protein